MLERNYYFGKINNKAASSLHVAVKNVENWQVHVEDSEEFKDMVELLSSILIIQQIYSVYFSLFQFSPPLRESESVDIQLRPIGNAALAACLLLYCLGVQMSEW